jgi:hypothetical protein
MLCIRILHNPQLLSRPEMTKLREASRIISAFRLFNNICGTLLDYSGKLSPHNDNGHHASSYNSAGCTCILTAHISADGCCGLYYIASFAFLRKSDGQQPPPPTSRAKEQAHHCTSLFSFLSPSSPNQLNSDTTEASLDGAPVCTLQRTLQRNA